MHHVRHPYGAREGCADTMSELGQQSDPHLAAMDRISYGGRLRLDTTAIDNPTALPALRLTPNGGDV